MAKHTAADLRGPGGDAPGWIHSLREQLKSGADPDRAMALAERVLEAAEGDLDEEPGEALVRVLCATCDTAPFLAPFLIIFAVFLAFPVFYSLYLALHQVPSDSFDIFGGLEFVAFKNFAKLFTDTKFWWSVLMTLYYAALIIPSGIAASLILALLLNNRLRFVAAYRSAFFMPYVLDMLVVGIVWTPDGRIITSALDGAVHSWDAETYAPIGTYREHSDRVTGMALDATARLTSVSVIPPAAAPITLTFTSS